MATSGADWASSADHDALNVGRVLSLTWTAIFEADESCEAKDLELGLSVREGCSSLRVRGFVLVSMEFPKKAVYLVEHP